MTVTEAVAKAKELFGIEPSAAYKGIETADDFVFAVQTDTTNQAAEGNWIVCADHVKEHSGALNVSTSDNTYIRSGTGTTKGATQRTLTINGDRCVGDAFQDFLLSHKIAFGSGQSVVVPYIYFSLRTGKGREGHWHTDPDLGQGRRRGCKRHLCLRFQGLRHSYGVHLRPRLTSHISPRHPLAGALFIGGKYHMIICNLEFEFSALNADDIDRMEAASKQQISRAKAEAKRLEQENASYSDILRSQCRVLMDYFDAVLGDGASQRLGLTGSDLGKCTQVATEFKAAIEAEKAAAQAAVTVPLKPQGNRAQRRAENKHKHKPSVGYPAAQPDKAARRKQLLAELAALENG